MLRPRKLQLGGCFDAEGNPIQCIDVPGNDTQYFQTGFNNGQANGYNAMNSTYSQAEKAEQFTSTNPMLPKQPSPEKKKKDPYFSLMGITGGLSWLSGIVERGRQNSYMRQQFANMNKQNPMPYTDYQPNPINPGSDYMQKGGPTTADSLALYNNSKQVTAYYNNSSYTPKGQVSYNNINVHKLNDMFSGSVNLAEVPTGEGKKLIKIDPKLYREDLDANRYKQRELANVILDTRAPMTLFDRRIAPTMSQDLQNTNKKDMMHGDLVSLYTYDPIAVKPYNMLTPEEKKLREKRYGPNKGVVVQQKLKSAPIMPPKPPEPQEPKFKRPISPATNIPVLSNMGQPQIGSPNVQQAGFDSAKPTNYSFTNATGNYLEGKQTYFPDEESLRRFAASQNNVSIQASSKGATATGYLRGMKKGGKMKWRGK